MHLDDTLNQAMLLPLYGLFNTPGSGPPYLLLPLYRLLPIGPQAVDAHPARSSPSALSAFLKHHDSRGVFRLSQDCHSSGGSGNGVIVALDLEGLRFAASRGLAEAVAAAWPGEGPLPRLRRTAAELLAGAAAGPTGDNSMSGTALCNALSRRLGEGFKEAVGNVQGKQLLMALADGGDEPRLITFDVQAVSGGDVGCAVGE